MIQLACNQIEKGFGAYDILKGVTFEVQDIERVGIVGRNGSGKTTLLKILMGKERQDKGEVFVRKGAMLGYVEQIPQYEAHFTGLDVLKTAFAPLYALSDTMHQLEEEMTKLEGEALATCLNKYSQLSESFEVQGGYQIEENLSKICTGLNLDEKLLSKSFNTLSGGEKTTVLLGKALLQKPDILLLDEPTNHLDMKGMEWLEEYLVNYKGAIVMVSHDRYFLDQVANKIVDIEGGKATTYKGNYASYCEEKEKKLLEEFEAYKEQQKKVKAMEKAIKRLRIWANQGDNEDLFKKAASMQKRLDKMEKLDKPVLEQVKIDLNFNEAERSGKDVIRLEAVSKAYEEKVLFEYLNFTMNYKERVALIGPNGCGKSTLIKMLLGKVEPDKGEITLGANLKMAYLPQNVRFLNEELTVLETFREGMSVSEEKARHILAKFLFYGEVVFKKVKNLSGGEKSRLLLCKLVQQDVNILILDEPTNHLDIDSRENLEEALQNFIGSILVISHDRFFINQVTKRIAEIEKGQIINYCGNYEYYREKKKDLYQTKEKIISKQKERIAPTSQSTKQESTTKNNMTLKKVEIELEIQEEKMKVLQEQMDLLTYDYEKWMLLDKERQLLQGEIEGLMERWLSLQK